MGTESAAHQWWAAWNVSVDATSLQAAAQGAAAGTPASFTAQPMAWFVNKGTLSGVSTVQGAIGALCACDAGAVCLTLASFDTGFAGSNKVYDLNVKTPAVTATNYFARNRPWAVVNGGKQVLLHGGAQGDGQVRI